LIRELAVRILIQESWGKLKNCRNHKRRGLITKISVDGGVNLSNLRDVLNAGVDIVTIGTYISQGDIAENISRINRLINC